jgi:hypothetical protein
MGCQVIPENSGEIIGKSLYELSPVGKAKGKSLENLRMKASKPSRNTGLLAANHLLKSQLLGEPKKKLSPRWD